MRCCSFIEAVNVPDHMDEPRRPRLKRGGARNRADRVSTQLTRSQCEKAIAACEAAIAVSRPPNRFITISWQLGGICPSNAVHATSKFIALARGWIESQGYKTAWLWVQEHGRRIGAHCHILLYVPPELDSLFSMRPRLWVKKILGGKYVKGSLLTRRLYFAPRKGPISDAYRAELNGRVHYLLKCAPAELETQLGCAFWSVVKWGKKEPVIGKRLAVWQGWKKRSVE